MTDQLILTKAIQKAEDNGWIGDYEKNGEVIPMQFGRADLTADDVFNRYEIPSLNTLIYNHEFAKALWPENKCKCGNDLGIPHSVLDGNGVHGKALSWSDHLQMMVLADDPITYLGNNI